MRKPKTSKSTNPTPTSKGLIKKKETNFKKDDWDCLGFMVVYYVIWVALIISAVAIVVTG